MAYTCLNAEECRVFLKNGKLRFQARKLNKKGEIEEQITITFPKDLAWVNTDVEDMDEEELDMQTHQLYVSRIKDYLKDIEL